MAGSELRLVARVNPDIEANCDRQDISRTGAILSERLDEHKIDQLRRWGSGLASADTVELRATGKAILLLIEEIEALHVDLWNAKAARVETAVDSEGSERDLDRSLSVRLRLSRRRAAADT